MKSMLVQSLAVLTTWKGPHRAGWADPYFGEKSGGGALVVRSDDRVIEVNSHADPPFYSPEGAEPYEP